MKRSLFRSRRSDTTDHWQESTLRECVTLLTGYPFSSTGFTEKPLDVKLVRGENVANRRLHWERCKRWPADGSCELETYQLVKGDIVLAMDGMVVGGLTRVARITQDDLPALLVQRVARLRGAQALDQRFLEYLVSTRDFRDYLWGVQTGTTISHVSAEQILQFRFRRPPLSEQRAIARVLGSLDDKIELNRHMNQTLEEICRALFKFWFVDFGPVRAKIEGRWKKGESLPGMPADMWDLWPSEFEESEKGEVPKGWNVEPLTATAKFLNGLACQRYPVEDGGGLPVLKIAELRRGQTLGADRASASVSPEYLVQDGDLVFSWSGSLEVKFWYGGRAVLNQHLFKVTSERFPLWLPYHWLLSHLDDFRHIAAGKATTMGHIQRHHLDDAPVVVPPTGLVVACNRIIGPLLSLVRLGEEQKRALATLRDTLLPKLLSGEIRVKVDA